MTTEDKNAPLTGEIVQESGEAQKTPSGRELSIRRYLFPALLDEKRDNHRSNRKILALVFAVVVLAGILALYIYGGSLAA
ncbi:MAG: hypothetical protein WD335_00135 [Candidatus Paceibacterota bacterium]